MNNSCFHAVIMSTMIQIRNVPEALHRQLKARSALEGISMSQFVLREISRALERPTRQEILKAIRAQPVAKLDPTPADLIREDRGTL